MSKRTGQVYWATANKIDRYDKKEYRRYVVVRDNGRSVNVAKIRGYNGNSKNDKRLYPLSMDKYPLTKPSGVDDHYYSRRVDNDKLLRLEDNEVFRKKPDFKLSSHDTHRVMRHARQKK